MAADDWIHELAHRFATLDMTGWDDAAFDRARAHLGWQPRRYTTEEQELRQAHPELVRSQEEFDTGSGSGTGRFARRGAEDAGSRISLAAGGAEAFPRLRSALEELLGPPFSMRGPGPVLRWRDPVRLLELEHDGGARLTIRPTDPVEADEYQASKWAEPEDGLQELGYWLAPGPEMDFVPGGYFAQDWAQFEQWLATTLRSVIGDFALLDPDTHFTVAVRTPSGHCAQWTTLPGWSLRLEARDPDVPGWRQSMAELGWQPPGPDDEPDWLVREHPVVDDQAAATAARMLVGALRSYGDPFEELWYLLISPDIHLLGIGLPDRQGSRF